MLDKPHPEVSERVIDLCFFDAVGYSEDLSNDLLKWWLETSHKLPPCTLIPIDDGAEQRPFVE